MHKLCAVPGLLFSPYMRPLNEPIFLHICNILKRAIFCCEIKQHYTVPMLSFLSLEMRLEIRYVTEKSRKSLLLAQVATLVRLQ